MAYDAVDPPIYHLALPEAWSRALELGSYDRSTRQQSVAEVGFIHCSESPQLPRTIAKFYSDLDRVVLLTIDTRGLDVRREPADGQLFPHIYSALPVTSVIAAREFSPLAGEAAPVLRLGSSAGSSPESGLDPA